LGYKSTFPHPSGTRNVPAYLFNTLWRCVVELVTICTFSCSVFQRQNSHHIFSEMWYWTRPNIERR